jgi:hypothetical protein
MMFSKLLRRSFVLLPAMTLLALPVRADVIELTNGDHYRGTVIAMTKSDVEFQSEIQGLVKLPRDKVAQIILHEALVKSVVVSKPVASISAPPVNAPLILSGPTATPAQATQADAVVQQMRQQGIDPKLIGQVQEQILGKSSPEASQKFNEMMGGLMSGKISVKDVRAQAQASIDQIKAAKKELGGDAGDMLDGYLGILEKFVQESAAEENSPVVQPAPSATPTK